MYISEHMYFRNTVRGEGGFCPPKRNPVLNVSLGMAPVSNRNTYVVMMTSSSQPTCTCVIVVSKYISTYLHCVHCCCISQAKNSHTNEVVAVKKMNFSGKQSTEVS